MGVKSSIRTSSIKPAAPKLSKVHFNKLNKKKIWSDFLCIFGNFLCIFYVIFSSTKIMKIILCTTKYVSVSIKTENMHFIKIKNY